MAFGSSDGNDAPLGARDLWRRMKLMPLSRHNFFAGVFLIFVALWVLMVIASHRPDGL